ncbi:MAG TPA: hypothetical protein VMI06_09730 [Terriglobia bacterium]|nr:hypothetical protein [Terriglobia bacterium]
MRMELDPQGTFRECLDQYLKYAGSSARGSDVLKVSFQTLSQGKEHLVEEVVGLVQTRTEPTLARPQEQRSV